ncbi:MAG: molybdenum cofactor biosynthesis protein B [Gemmatimonadota bacterium]
MSEVDPIRVGVLTVSDGVHAGARADRSGDLIASWAMDRGYELAVRAVSPDERARIAALLAEWVDERGCDVVLTTGGTGFTERDVTPEATRAVIQREAPGLAEAIRAAGLKTTVHSMLSRGVAGLRRRTLIVNLPGSPRGVEDGLTVLGEVVSHAVALLRGAETDHG